MTSQKGYFGLRSKICRMFRQLNEGIKLHQRDKRQIGILAYGSLIGDPGSEIEPLIVERVPTETPFPVEFARISGSRGGAPTVVPHSAGQKVKAEVLVLDGSVSLTEARDMLWRREIHRVGSKRKYQASDSPNSVLVMDWPAYLGVSHVLYTDFNVEGKLEEPDAASLAGKAIESVNKAKPKEDGISYLIALKKAGVETKLSEDYEAAILKATGAANLESALIKLRKQRLGAEPA